MYDLPYELAQERAQIEKQQLARRSLKGPANEVIWGSIFLTWAPIVGSFVQLVAGPPILDCFLETGPEGDACEARAHEQEQRAFRAGLVVGAGMGLIGLGMIGHGIARIRSVRAARREVLLSRFNVALEQGGARMQLGVAF